MSAPRDPWSEVLGLVRTDRPWLATAIAVASCLHASVATAVARWPPAAPLARRPASATQAIFVDLPKPPPPVPFVEPPSPPAPVDARPARLSAPSPSTTGRRSPAASVQKSSDEPLDLTGQILSSDSSLVGSSGVPSGSGSVAGLSGAAPPRLANARVAPAAPAPGPDRSCRPEPLGDSRWVCPFPPEADGYGIDSAVVTLRARIDASGVPGSILAIGDPGHGFGREAQRCAAAKRWRPALDRDGQPTEGWVTVRVHFDR
jgi:protein TonB